MAFDSDAFSIQNIPYGVTAATSTSPPTIVTRFHDHVYFIPHMIEAGVLPGLSDEIKRSLASPTLNAFAAQPKAEQLQVRSLLQKYFRTVGSANSSPAWCKPAAELTMTLPVNVGDFSDFLCGKDHYQNFMESTQGKKSLPPNFLHWPIGYTGKSASIVPTGYTVPRPWGLFKRPEDPQTLVFGTTEQMDFELEFACVIGKPSKQGEPVKIADADEHIFGFVLLNDWSARDIQMLEMVPLGTTNGKSAGTGVSPWIVTLEALKPFEIAGPPRDVPVAAYLEDPQPIRHRITVQAEIIEPGGTATVVSKASVRSLYWSFRDLVAHQTLSGCAIRTGDILAAGTISGPGEHGHGCLMELSEDGKKKFKLEDGSERTYMLDGDTVRFRAWTEADGGVGAAEGAIGFGDYTGSIGPAVRYN